MRFDHRSYVAIPAIHCGCPAIFCSWDGGRARVHLAECMYFHFYLFYQEYISGQRRPVFQAILGTCAYIETTTLICVTPGIVIKLVSLRCIFSVTSHMLSLYIIEKIPLRHNTFSSPFSHKNSRKRMSCGTYNPDQLLFSRRDVAR